MFKFLSGFTPAPLISRSGTGSPSFLPWRPLFAGGFVSRFVGPVRPIIPVVAGMLGMRPLHFGVVNVLSAIGWAFVYILPGVFFGTSLAMAGAVSTRLAVLIFILLAAVWGFIWLSRKLILLVGHRGPIWLAALKDRVTADTPVHGVVLPLKRCLSYLFLRQQGEELFLGFLVLMLFVAGWGFLGVLQDVLAKDPLVLADGWRELPAWRIDMAGEWEQPLTIQWAGSPEDLAHYLLTKGWQNPPSLNLKSFLGMFSPDTPIEKLPILPRLHNGRVDRLRLVHRLKGQRWVLRLWPAAVKIAGNNTSLFVGTIEVQHRRHLTWLITAAMDTGEYDRSLDALEQELHDRFAMKLVNRRSNVFQVSHEDLRVRWKGRVLLLWGNAEL
jgi:hypothetical protein